MKKRTLLATATLTALVLSSGALQPVPIDGAATLASYAQPLDAQLLDAQAPSTVGHPTSPQWGWVWGWGGNESMSWSVIGTLVCAAFTVPGAIACGITGAL